MPRQLLQWSGLFVRSLLPALFLFLLAPAAQAADSNGATAHVDSTDRPVDLATYCRYFRTSPYCAPKLSGDDGGPRLYVIYFDPEDASIRPGEEAMLRSALAAAKLERQASIAITGHTDRLGDEEEAIDLSVRRAAAVSDWLIDEGIEKERISLSGAGYSRTLLPARDGGGENLNRRAEIILDIF